MTACVDCKGDEKTKSAIYGEGWEKSAIMQAL